jgi:signal transduction histidine kinase
MSFRLNSIKHKLMLMILLASSTALLIACGAFTVIEISTFRSAMARDLGVLADVLANNSTAALSFENSDDAREILKSLGNETQIASACLYGNDGRLFVGYNRNGVGSVFPLHPGSDGSSFSGDHCVIFRPVVLNNERIGTIYLQADLAQLYVRLKALAITGFVVLLVSMIAAFFISIFLQRLISEPILSLAAVSRLISENRNYSLRAIKRSEDELGLFTDAFNQMLETIEERNTALLQANETLKEQVMARVQAEEQLKALNEDLERRVQERTQELKRSNEELEQFAYVASHDLQEPLRMVASYMQLIERRYKDKLDADADKFIGFAVDGAKRMQALIQDLLAYSRVGTRHNPFQTIDCTSIVNGVVADLKLTIDEIGAKVRYNTLPTVNGDSIQLAQVFQNLISNALKFKGNASPEIYISARRDGDFWVFSIKDNGIGIDPQYFNRIFVIFQRLHTRQEYAGTGIGLAVCKKIIERHGGRIWVESEPGKGTTFHFSILDKKNTLVRVRG